MAKPFRITNCPMCGWTRSVYRKKAQRRVFRYGHGTVPLEDFEVVRWMKGYGHPRDGRKRGFEVVKGMTIRQALQHESTMRMVDDIYNRAKELVEYIDMVKGERDGRAAAEEEHP